MMMNLSNVVRTALLPFTDFWSEELQTQIDEGKEKIIKLAGEIDQVTKLIDSL